MEKTFYKIVFKRDRSPLIITEKMALSLLDNYTRSNSPDDLIVGYDEETEQRLMISKSEIAYIVFHYKEKFNND
jgi:hypothetical protein